MHRKREVMEAREAWLRAQHDSTLRSASRSKATPTMRCLPVNIRRFRAAVLAERAARLRYAKSLEAARKVVPEDLLWDVDDTSQSGSADSE